MLHLCFSAYNSHRSTSTLREGSWPWTWNLPDCRGQLPGRGQLWAVNWLAVAIPVNGGGWQGPCRGTLCGAPMHTFQSSGGCPQRFTHTHTHTHTHTRITSALRQRLNFDFSVHFIFIISLAKSLLNAKLFFGLSNISYFTHWNISKMLFPIFKIHSVFQLLLRKECLCLPKVCLLKPHSKVCGVCVYVFWLFCDSMDCSPPGSSVHGIFQGRILEWVAISYSRGSSPPRDWNWVSCVSCIGRLILYYCATWEAPMWW